MQKTGNGFSLIELLIALTVLGILVGIATPSYISYLRESRRADALNSVLSISLAEERYRSSHSTYGTLAQVWGGVTASNQGYYTLSISNTSATSYTITATATGNQVNDAVGATSCSSMVYAMSSGAVTKTPTACWPS
jgi:type IV pilus assembly protein PilE